MDIEPTVAASLIESAVPDLPDLAMVLGSGFRSILEDWEIEASFPFSDLPGFYQPQVPGHEEAAILVARRKECRVVIVSGRMHFYEGYSMDSATLAIRVLHHLGIEKLLLTCSAGAIRNDLRVGDMVFIVDHINFMGVNPLHKWSWADGDGFLDLSRIYSERLNLILENCSRAHGIRIGRGVYVGVPGPTFETPAEVRMMRTWGGDLVGMSVLPEAVVAHRYRMEVAGLAFIANLAAGISFRDIHYQDSLRLLKERRKIVSDYLHDFCVEADAPRS